MGGNYQLTLKKQKYLSSINLPVVLNAKQKHLRCKKSARPIRSSLQAVDATKSFDIS